MTETRLGLVGIGEAQSEYEVGRKSVAIHDELTGHVAVENEVIQWMLRRLPPFSLRTTAHLSDEVGRKRAGGRLG